jgi:hypothetical protein
MPRATLADAGIDKKFDQVAQRRSPLPSVAELDAELERTLGLPPYRPAGELT